MAAASPKIQFKEPEFDPSSETGASKPRLPVNPPSTALLTGPGRLSSVSASNVPRLSSSSGRRSVNSSDPEDDDDHDQDWTVKTADKDTWAARERRRASLWNKIDSYPTIKPGSPSTSPKERHGSILSLFQHGKDKDGRAVLHSGENVEDWDRHAQVGKEKEVLIVPVEKTSRSGSRVQERHGSILSMWTNGKDENGRDVLLQG